MFSNPVRNVPLSPSLFSSEKGESAKKTSLELVRELTDRIDTLARDNEKTAFAQSYLLPVQVRLESC